MATIVNLKDKKYFVVGEGIIVVSEKDIPFDSAYEVISPKTGVQKRFRFHNSTGPEGNPQTEWIYISEESHQFRVFSEWKYQSLFKFANIK